MFIVSWAQVSDVDGMACEPALGLRVGTLPL